MGSRRRSLFILLFVLGLMLGSALIVINKPTKLGLDLRGGTELVYQGRPTPQVPEITGEDMDRALDIIRERTDKLGVAEPEIARIGADQISVGLPDVQNAERAIQQVGDTAQLFLYDWQKNVIPRPGARDPAEDGFPRLYDAVQLAAKQKPSCPPPGPVDRCTTTGPTFYLFDKQSQQLLAGPESARADLFVDQPNERQPAGSEVVVVPQGTVVVLDSPRADDPSTEVDESETAPKEYFVLNDDPELTGTDIRNPEQNFDPTTNQPIITFDFTDKGREAFHRVTKRIAERGLAKFIPGDNPEAVSEHFAIVLDDEVVSRPIINFQENPDGIDGRTGAQISGNFQLREAQDLAEFLRIGALPIELKLISQTTVSATLGQEALDQGLYAGIAGLVIVICFLLVYYRFLGVVATLGLLIYALFFYALMELIPVTLTLPGIAGLILTIGVAADSNIVIFERIKEEARAGKTMPSAISAGYRHGIATIIDANVITLITAFILFVLATAGVKGFAFTLGVGTVVSLFTAVVFTQAFLGWFGRARFMRSPIFLGAGEQRVNWRFDFTGLSRWFFSMSGTILLVGALSFTSSGFNFGIDFESGTRIKAAVDRPVSVDKLRSTLDPLGLGDAEIQQVTDKELGGNAFQISTATLEPDQVGEVQASLDQSFGLRKDAFDTQSIGPTFGESVARSAVYAILFSLLVISAYVAFRFEAKYSVPVLIAVIHDILITSGVYSLSGREVSSATVAAFLTILGYSLYDTVIVFDRIRENVPRLPRATFSQIVNRSVSEVMTRSLITGLSTVFLVTMLLVFGGETLKDFAFAMMVGLASGTYSSIFIASPVLTHWKEREPAYRRRRERIEEQMGRIPAFPEENVIERLERERVPAATRAAVPVEPTAPVPGVLPPSGVQAPPSDGDAEPEPVGDVAAGDGGAGAAQPGDRGDGAPRPPDAAARSQRRERRRGRRKRKHGRQR